MPTSGSGDAGASRSAAHRQQQVGRKRSARAMEPCIHGHRAGSAPPVEPRRGWIQRDRAPRGSTTPRCMERRKEGFMRPRRRRPRGMRPSEPPQLGAAFEGQGYEAPDSSPPPAYETGPPGEPLGFPPPSSELPSMSGPQRPWGEGVPSANGTPGMGYDRQGIGRRRRRRPRSGPRPQGANPQQQPPPPQGGYPQFNNQNPRRARGRRRDGIGVGGGPPPTRRPQRPGLEILKDLQQAGAALDPTERLVMELLPGQGNPPYGDRITGRAIDLIAPIGRGQRCLLVAPPKAGKTRILQAIAASVAHNHPEVKVYALLDDERPEEVTDFKRNTPAEGIAASSDMSLDEHIETTELAMQKVAADVLAGKDVMLLLDSITRLARAYHAAAGNGGRTMSGGLDSNAMQSPRQIFGAARKIENAGSLTIIGTALVDTGSRMDQIIFEEFKGTGNSEIFLSRELAERRIYPAIDIQKSGTRKEEKLYPPEIVPRLHLLRRGLAGLHPQEAMTKLLELLTRCKTNEDIFELLRA